MHSEAEKIRLIAVDLDGTLLTTAGTVAVEGARWLQQAAGAGVHVVIATTRLFGFAYATCQVLGACAPLICANGAQVYGSPDGPLWTQYAIDQEAALAITRLADEHQWELSTTVGRMTFLRQRVGQPLGELRPDITIVPTNAAAVVGTPIRMLTWQPEAAAAIHTLCETKLAGCCYTELYLRADGSFESMGVFAPQANKGTALRYVLDQLKIPGEQVMTIGDNFNDLPMFACGRISIAMDNAPSAVKQQATHIAPNNDEEGVAWAVRQWAVASNQ